MKILKSIFEAVIIGIMAAMFFISMGIAYTDYGSNAEFRDKYANQVVKE